MTDRYAVFGHPVGHSKSPRIHALFAAQTGQDLEYRAIEAPLQGFAAALRAFIADGGRGANVTVPFKEEAYRLADRVAHRARAAGAANTLSFVGGVIEADNTDGAGLLRDLRSNLGAEVAGKRVLLLGAGGAARGALPALLAEAPAELVIANRSSDKAQRLSAEFVAYCPPTSRLQGGGFSVVAGRRFDLVINATSAGLSDSSLDLPPELLVPGVLAYEMVYGRDTSFLVQARAGGAATADGLGMLVEQAAEAFLIWRGLRPQTEAVLALLRAEAGAA
jgi:shikimate dehydrogenase